MVRRSRLSSRSMTSMVVKSSMMEVLGGGWRWESFGIVLTGLSFYAPVYACVAPACNPLKSQRNSPTAPGRATFDFPTVLPCFFALFRSTVHGQEDPTYSYVPRETRRTTPRMLRCCRTGNDRHPFAQDCQVSRRSPTGLADS